MPRTWRQRRGQQTAQLVAEYLRPLAPGAEATPSAYAGTDIRNVPWDVEVKAPREDAWVHSGTGADHPPSPESVLCTVCSQHITHRRFSLRGALRQAAKRRSPEHVLPPMVVLRPDGTGESNVGEFVVIRFFSDDRAILDELLWLRWLMPHLTRMRRGELLDYTDRNGGLLSQEARAELEEFRANGSFSGTVLE